MTHEQHISDERIREIQTYMVQTRNTELAALCRRALEAGEKVSTMKAEMIAQAKEIGAIKADRDLWKADAAKYEAELQVAADVLQPALPFKAVGLREVAALCKALRADRDRLETHIANWKARFEEACAKSRSAEDRATVAEIAVEEIRAERDRLAAGEVDSQAQLQEAVDEIKRLEEENGKLREAIERLPLSSDSKRACRFVRAVLPESFAAGIEDFKAGRVVDMEKALTEKPEGE